MFPLTAFPASSSSQARENPVAPDKTLSAKIDVEERSVDHLGFALSFEGLLNGIPFFACPGDVEIHIDESPC